MVVVTWPRRSEARSLSFGGGDCFGPDSWDRSESLGNPPEPRRSSVARRQSGCRQDPPRRSWSGLGRPLHALGGAPNRPSQPRSKTLGRLRSSSKIRPKGCRSRRAQRPDTSLAILLREQKTPIRPTPSSVMPLIASTAPEPWPRRRREGGTHTAHFEGRRLGRSGSTSRVLVDLVRTGSRRSQDFGKPREHRNPQCLALSAMQIEGELPRQRLTL